jgi:DNA-binding NtrC family response regulator
MSHPALVTTEDQPTPPLASGPRGARRGPRHLRMAAGAEVATAVSELGMTEHGLYGASPVMRALFRRIRKVGPTAVPVLVTGESGTGKSLVARALHAESPRRHRPFVAFHCSALPEEFGERELFGPARGALRGGVKERGGLFAAAQGGTLFLDEIGDLGPMAQARLVRALEQSDTRRADSSLGAHAARRTDADMDVRVIAASSRPLPALVAEGRFREDLLYRLKVVELALPPLRARREDIPLLCAQFVQPPGAWAGAPERPVSEEAMARLLAHDWAGNVRELRNVIEGALVLSDGATIAATDLPADLPECGASASVVAGESAAGPLIETLSARADAIGSLTFVEAREWALREFDRAFLGAALARHDGNVARTARALGLHRQSLQKLLARRALRAGGAGR